VTLPLLAPAIIAAASIVFLFTFTSFGVALLLADPAHATLEVEIYRQAIQLFDLRTAAALALVQIVAVLAVVFALDARAGTAGGRAAVSSAAWIRPVVPAARRRSWSRPCWAARCASSGARLRCWCGGPCASAVTGALSSYRALGSSASTNTLFVSPWAAVRNSIEFAAIATVNRAGGGRRGVGRDRRPLRRGDAHVRRIPHAPARNVGRHRGDSGSCLRSSTQPNRLATSPLLVPIAHAVVAIPFVVRAVVPALRSIDPRLRDAATMLGAAPRRVWREVDLPITMRAFAVAAGFCAAVSLGEFGGDAVHRPARLADGADRESSDSWRGRARSTSTRRSRCRLILMVLTAVWSSPSSASAFVISASSRCSRIEGAVVAVR